MGAAIRRLSLTMLVALVGGCVQNQPPAAQREFRGAWVATVANIDWPSRPGLSAGQQQQEMLAILDRAAELKLNVIILQVRTSCDALYPSELEPWSEYLTGEQGKPPEPMYDPLAMWISEAHKRGIELHAWFNPFRARQNSARGAECATHISKTRPDLVREYGKYLWLDPGEAEAREYSLRVIMDVVNRYDIDGVHIDDYFYPYPVKEAGDFPDEASWQKYVASGGKLSRADWRRDNINRMIEEIYSRIKRAKPYVQFGVSPFGIWKPGYPAKVKGFNQYESIYADAKLWLNRGWCDYFSPQIYWKIAAPAQPYKDLLDWWIGENTQGRQIVPGNYTSRINNTAASWNVREIIDQIEVTRLCLGASGNIHFSMKALMENRKGIADALKSGPYAEPALVPAATWLSSKKPAAPRVELTRGDGEVSLSIEPGDRDAPRVWTVYVRYSARLWRPVRIVSADQRRITVPADIVLGLPSEVAVGAVDRFGNESDRTVWKLP